MDANLGSKSVLAAAAAVLVTAPALCVGAAAATGTAHGSWAFSDYTPDPGSLAADDAIHVATGATIRSWCHGTRLPSAPQDATTRSLRVATRSVLTLHLTSTGVWGVDVNTSRGSTLAGVTSAPNAGDLSLRLPAGRYTVVACNLGGAPNAQVGYTLTRSR